MGMFSLLRNILYYLGYFVYYTVIILGAGTVIGLILFTLLGPLFGEYSFSFLLKKGAWVGFRYAGVWAGGVSIVLCIIRWKKIRDSKL